jgi:hypothetical protein
LGDNEVLRFYSAHPHSTEDFSGPLVAVRNTSFDGLAEWTGKLSHGAFSVAPMPNAIARSYAPAPPQTVMKIVTTL